MRAPLFDSLLFSRRLDRTKRALVPQADAITVAGNEFSNSRGGATRTAFVVGQYLAPNSVQSCSDLFEATQRWPRESLVEREA